MVLKNHRRHYFALGPCQMLVLHMTGDLASRYQNQITRSAIGATCNVMGNLVALDRDWQTGVITALPTDGDGVFVCEQIRAMGIDNGSHLVYMDQNPRLQTPTITQGFPNGDRGRVPIVRRLNDAMANLTLEQARQYWDFDKLMKQTSLLHMCMHELGLNDAIAKIYRELIEAAKRHHVTVMVNLNFRKGLFPTDADMEKWRAYCREFAALADILVGSQEKALSDLKLNGVDPHFIFECFPGIKLLALTGRDAKAKTYSAKLMLPGNYESEVSNLPCNVRWPIGSGDAFDAGLIHALAKGWDYQKSLEFAVNCARDNLATVGDRLLANEQEILDWVPISTRT